MMVPTDDIESGIKSIYVIKVDMENRSVDDIARDAVNQIATLCDRLIEES